MFEELKTTADFGSGWREIATTPEGLVLTVHKPAAGAARGSVLLIPGWSGPRSGPADLLAWLAQELAAAGWKAVRMDLPGRGDSAGDFAGVDLDGMIAAADTVAQSSQNSGPLFLLGLCSGGNVALGASTIVNPAPSPYPLPQGEREKRRQGAALQNGVIALSALPFQPARSKRFERHRRWKNIKNYASKALSPDTWARLLRGEINLERVKKNVTTTEKPAAGDRNLKDSARGIEKELLGWRGAALFVWGGGDEEAPPARAHFEKLHAAGMGSPEQTAFHTIPGANHNFYARAWREELRRVILAFLDDRQDR
ncbi:MAG: alpha/beta hydrolase [Planctomycetota bacterium]